MIGEIADWSHNWRYYFTCDVCGFTRKTFTESFAQILEDTHKCEDAASTIKGSD